MISRSRDTKHFLLCINERSYEPECIKLQDILAEMLFSACSAYTEKDVDYKHVFWQGNCKPKERTTMNSQWATCNPRVKALVLNERIRRITRNYFRRAILDTLKGDGATVADDEFAFPELPEDEKDVKPEKVKPTDMSEEQFQHKCKKLEEQYRFKGFTKMQPDELERYEKKDVFEAYKRRSLLHSYGPDHNSALQAMAEDDCRSREAHEACAASGLFKQSAVTASEIIAGHMGKSSQLNIFRTAAAFVKEVTGAEDPCKIPRLNDQVCVTSEEYIPV